MYPNTQYNRSFCDICTFHIHFDSFDCPKLSFGICLAIEFFKRFPFHSDFSVRSGDFLRLSLSHCSVCTLRAFSIVAGCGHKIVIVFATHSRCLLVRCAQINPIRVAQAIISAMMAWHYIWHHLYDIFQHFVGIATDLIDNIGWRISYISFICLKIVIETFRTSR